MYFDNRCINIFLIHRTRYFSNKKKQLAGPDRDYGAVNDDLGCNVLGLSEEEIEEKKSSILNKIKLSIGDIHKIERHTIGQSSNESWKNERQYRLTASHFGKVCTLRPTTPRDNTIKYILYGEKLFGTTPAMKLVILFKQSQKIFYFVHVFNIRFRYGIQNESIAKNAFEEACNLSCDPCGLFVDEQFHFLAASPDGLINHDGILEVKCPFSIKHITPQEAAINKILKYLIVNKEGAIELKRTHHYFYQIQGQLHITKRKYCYLVVWTPKGITYHAIIFNSYNIL